MTTARSRRHEATRSEILDAAWTQAEEKGIAAISLREVAAAVGMRAPSLYTYFASKDAIYDAMFAEGYEALTRFNDEIVRRVAGLERVEALAEAAERFIAFCQASPARYQLMFTRAVPGWEPSPEAYAVSMASYGSMEATLASVGIEGRDGVDLYVALTAGLAAQQMANQPTGHRWRKLARNAMEMLVDHLDQTRGDAP